MTEHQIHILTRVVLALFFLVGLISLFVFLSKRRAKTISAETKKNGEVELLNFDEAARRRKNNRAKRGKDKRQKR